MNMSRIIGFVVLVALLSIGGLSVATAQGSIPPVGTESSADKGDGASSEQGNPLLERGAVSPLAATLAPRGGSNEEGNPGGGRGTERRPGDSNT